MSSELLPCPFCGGKAVEYTDSALVDCDACGVMMYGDSPDQAIESWNRRATPSGFYFGSDPAGSSQQEEERAERSMGLDADVALNWLCRAATVGGVQYSAQYVDKLRATLLRTSGQPAPGDVKP